MRRIKVDHPVQKCPQPCGHAHPGGAGVGICGCTDCYLLFGGQDPQWFAPRYQERLKELRRLQEAEVPS